VPGRAGLAYVESCVGVFVVRKEFGTVHGPQPGPVISSCTVDGLKLLPLIVIVPTLPLTRGLDAVSTLVIVKVGLPTEID
jgi:hypothetical protein